MTWKYDYDVLIKTEVRSYYASIGADSDEDAIATAIEFHNDEFPNETITTIEIIERNLC